jgi:hypothetical protein
MKLEPIDYWDRDGWAIWYKRLEAGTFQFPFSETGRKEVAAWELPLLLEGILLKKGKRRAGTRTRRRWGATPWGILCLLLRCVSQRTSQQADAPGKGLPGKGALRRGTKAACVA